MLDDITPDNENRNTKQGILQEYLELVKPRDTSEDAVFLNDIMEMWSFAAQVNDDGVLSSVAVVLALLLSVVSESLSLVQHGMGICQTLLQERQLKSISKNLSSDKAKGFIISPTLRLLRQAVCLDGGAYAKRIVRARNFTFSSLGRNLELGFVGDGQEEARKASVRTNAVRFFLSCLKYLHSDGKRELLLQRELLSHLTFAIKNDPPYLVLEILDILKAHVLMDTKIPREAKSKNLTIKTLMRLLALYSYSSNANEGKGVDDVKEKAHQFLVFACTTPGAGVLYPSTGLFPKESDEGLSGLSAKRSGSFEHKIPVFNFVLSEFATKLRPWSSLKHNELLIAMFTAVPELIADYFVNNRSFTFEPKLSMTWIGYAAFLFNTISIPLPPCFGNKTQHAKGPPPTSILLDNILPLPINQKVLIRCLSPKSNLTSFFATRIMVLALEKLAVAVKMHESTDASKDGQWRESTRRLIDGFCQRIPDMKEIVRSYKSIPVENVLHKTMASRLLRLYYEIIPQVALAANFDVSSFFVDVLQRLHDDSRDSEVRSFDAMELENLVSIASYSPGMRWFSKTEVLKDRAPSSPFIALLQLLYSSDHNAPLHQLGRVLADVAVENQFVSRNWRLKPLLKALRITMTEFATEQATTVWSFLDNCVSRCAASPIKYLDQVQTYLADSEYARSGSNSEEFDLLTVALAEQLPFLTGSATIKDSTCVARFLSLYFNAQHSGERTVALSCLHHRIREHLSTQSIEMLIFGDSGELKLLKYSRLVDRDDQDFEPSTRGKEGEMSDEKFESLLHIPISTNENAVALAKWPTKSVDDLIEDGWAANLIELLLSEHRNIRKETLTSILKMAAKIDESGHDEKKQVWLLLSELAESSKPQVEAGPVPSAFTAFAKHALDVLRHPLHPLYSKINAFLTRSPVWSLDKLPMAHDILHGEPSEDDRYYTEITWFLTYVLDGLKTPFDLDVFHKKRWFEKILSLGSNPYLRSNLRLRILRILYRATCIDTGSTTLVTRFGVLSWLEAQRVACDDAEDAELCEGLMKRIWKTCDQDRVAAWSKGGAGRLVEKLLQG